ASTLNFFSKINYDFGFALRDPVNFWSKSEYEEKCSKVDEYYAAKWDSMMKLPDKQPKVQKIEELGPHL
ncbi:MAG: hypothetical protein MHPSP_003060, partial [Paramarteilia canceri]